MCVYEGDVEFSSLKHRVIYRVTCKEPTCRGLDESGWTSPWLYTFSVAFDMFPESSHDLKTSPYNPVFKRGTRGIRRLQMLDIARLRNDIDLFLRQVVAVAIGEGDETV